MMHRQTILLVLAICVASDASYAVMPQRASHFVGAEVGHRSQQTAASRQPSSRRGDDMTMKKGKANVNPQMRSQYKRAQEMEAYRKQMVDSQNYGPDGLPVFNLFVRTSLKNMWYPCGSFKGDEKSAALCKSFVDQGMLSSISKNQLDAGVGGSLARDQAKLEETIVRGYPQLRKDKGKLEYGYKLSYPGLSKEQDKIWVVEVKEQKGFLDGIKSAFGGN